MFIDPLEPNTSPVVVSESEKCSDQDDEIDKQLTAEELQMVLLYHVIVDLTEMTQSFFASLKKKMYSCLAI